MAQALVLTAQDDIFSHTVKVTVNTSITTTTTKHQRHITDLFNEIRDFFHKNHILRKNNKTLRCDEEWVLYGKDTR